jgi:hypothetical protein
VGTRSAAAALAVLVAPPRLNIIQAGVAVQVDIPALAVQALATAPAHLVQQVLAVVVVVVRIPVVITVPVLAAAVV